MMAGETLVLCILADSLFGSVTSEITGYEYGAWKRIRR
jgi:hypothetical protein